MLSVSNSSQASWEGEQERTRCCNQSFWPENTQSVLCFFIRKKAAICSSFISIVGAAFMLTSKSARSYEMIIVARTLYGYSAGKTFTVTSLVQLRFYQTD